MRTEQDARRDPRPTDRDTAPAVAEHEARAKAEAIQEAQRYVTPEQLAEIMHDVYEKESRAAGWNTQEACHVPFGELPEANKRVMLQVARAVLWATPDLAEMEVRLKREGAAEELRRMAVELEAKATGGAGVLAYRISASKCRFRADELEKK